MSPARIDWFLIVRQVREATEGLRRIRLHLGPTNVGWISGQFEPVGHALGVARVTLSTQAPRGSDLGDLDDPPEVRITQARERTPITPALWRVLSTDAELVYDRLTTLAANPELDRVVVDHLARAAELHRAAWRRLAELPDIPRPDSPEATNNLYRALMPLHGNPRVRRPGVAKPRRRRA